MREPGDFTLRIFYRGKLTRSIGKTFVYSFICVMNAQQSSTLLLNDVANVFRQPIRIKIRKDVSSIRKCLFA